MEQQGWILVDKGSKLKRKHDQYYIELSNAYSSLAEFSANLSPDDAPTSAACLFKLQATKTGINESSAKSKRNSKIQQTQMTQSLSNTSTWQRTNAQKWQRMTNPTGAGWRLIHHTRHPPNQNRPCYNRARTSAARLVQRHADWSAKSPTPTSIASCSRDKPWWQNTTPRIQQYWSLMTQGRMITT